MANWVQRSKMAVYDLFFFFFLFVYLLFPPPLSQNMQLLTVSLNKTTLSGGHPPNIKYCGQRLRSGIHVRLLPSLSLHVGRGRAIVLTHRRESPVRHDPHNYTTIPLIPSRCPNNQTVNRGPTSIYPLATYKSVKYALGLRKHSLVFNQFILSQQLPSLASMVGTQNCVTFDSTPCQPAGTNLVWASWPLESKVFLSVCCCVPCIVMFGYSQFDLALYLPPPHNTTHPAIFFTI
ncbi:uncharacterized protein FMAN_09521 [Fusarium mangiferae]|uniref:Uncharacterized protein n=1 Tax=Fusarium mangiferae TaxID=192010 RepID=A0A1L7T0E9_FUSMA|nr:uncharacterized protein FMAN_09521 [Fusarium mangiferae]CVK91399.1 uncharacterized protein FMAN_09521 [Fusarium mangiferae]